MFQSQFVVAKPGDLTVQVVADDGFLLGVGGGATGSSGPSVNPPASGTTPFGTYPLVAANNQLGGATPQTYPVTIHFPSAGTYPNEPWMLLLTGRPRPVAGPGQPTRRRARWRGHLLRHRAGILTFIRQSHHRRRRPRHRRHQFG